VATPQRHPHERGHGYLRGGSNPHVATYLAQFLVVIIVVTIQAVLHRDILVVRKGRIR
jgi:hypothetical protein